VRGVFHRHFLALLLFSMLCASPAFANGVVTTISNGVAKTGTVTGSGHDDYTYTAQSGGSLLVTAGETGAHDDNFVLTIDRTTPGGDVRGTGKTYSVTLAEQNVSEGNWVLKVLRADGGNTGGAYKITLVQIPGASGTAMSNGHTYDGSVGGGEIDVYTFTGAAGVNRTVTLTRTDENGAVPGMSVYTPTGAPIANMSCASSCPQDVQVAADGTYTVLVSRQGDSAAAGAYSISVKNSN
jgi:hypothetical protein